jgi:hypothetical protein
MLDGVLLAGAQPNEVGMRRRQVKTIHETGDLERREFLAYQDAGYPDRLWKREFSLRYSAIRDCYDVVEQILAESGPFTCALWKMEHLAYSGDGARLEFFLPFEVACQVISPLPIEAAKIQPVVRIGRDGTPLTYAAVAAATYAGTPPAGTAWFLEGSGLAFKVPSAPAAGAKVHVRFAPLYEVLEREETEKRYVSPTREPRDIELLET